MSDSERLAIVEHELARVRENQRLLAKAMGEIMDNQEDIAAGISKILDGCEGLSMAYERLAARVEIAQGNVLVMAHETGVYVRTIPIAEPLPYGGAG